MNTRSYFPHRGLLLVGDVLTLALVTLFGFASHGALDSAGTRMLSTFFPLLIAWFLVAPHLNVFNLNCAQDVRQIWRPFWAMVLAAPLAAWLRGVYLNNPILPIFVVILGGVSALALLAWRALFAVIVSRKKS